MLPRGPAGGRPRDRPRPLGRGAGASRGRGARWRVWRVGFCPLSAVTASPQGPACEKVSRLWRDSCDMRPPRREESPGQRNPRLRSESCVLLTVKGYGHPIGVSGAARLLGHSSCWARSGSWYQPLPLGQARLPPGIWNWWLHRLHVLLQAVRDLQPVPNGEIAQGLPKVVRTSSSWDAGALVSVAYCKPQISVGWISQLVKRKWVWRKV